MIVQLDPSSNVPLYQQIHSLIVRGIASGLLKPGDQLPSVRQLGEDLGVNLHTVNKAYQGLRDDGYIALTSRSGAVVDLSGLDRPRFDAGLKEQLSDLIAEAICHNYTAEEFEKLSSQAFKELGSKGSASSTATSSTDKGDR